MAKDKDDFYCIEMLKAGLTESGMSAGQRAFSIIVGIFGTIIVDPVHWGIKVLGINDENPAPDPDDPTNPSNMNY